MWAPSIAKIYWCLGDVESLREVEEVTVLDPIPAHWRRGHAMVYRRPHPFLRGCSVDVLLRAINLTPEGVLTLVPQDTL